jgi:ferric-dicitrate binding protein FerR (iron transport regulator)
VTLWVKPLDIAGARYVAVKDVDLMQTVDDFIARWMAQAKLDVDPSRVTLRLVRCAGEEPTAEEEAAATVLSPRRKLREAGVTAGCSLLAFVAGALGAVRPRVSRVRIDADARGACSRRRARCAARGFHCGCVFCASCSHRRSLTSPHGRDAAGRRT